MKVGPWTRFLRLVGVGKANEVTPANHFGIFHLGIRRLADLGVVTNPRKGGDKRRWEGDWVKPLKEKFLASPVLQYQVFGKSMIDYRRRIEADPSLKSAIGKTYEGKVATLSGLLAVAHNAGLQGLKKWIANDPPRGKFRETLSAYERTTGLF